MIGTAVSVQFGIGFLLTMPGMWIVPLIVDETSSWPFAWGSLVPGTLVAIFSMAKLRMNQDAQNAAKKLGRKTV